MQRDNAEEMGDNAEEMGEKDAIRAEQTPRKMGEAELYTQTEMQQTFKGKKKTLLINNIKS